MIDPAAQACEAYDLNAQWFLVGILVGALLIAFALVIGPRR